MRTHFYFTILFILFLSFACQNPQTKNDNSNNSDEKNVILQQGLLKKSEFEKGKELYVQKCATCHQENGEGITGQFPPLANSNFLNPAQAIKAVLHGVKGETEVNGSKYNTEMPAVKLNDKEVKNVVNFILNSWGNQKGKVTEQDVTELR